MSAKAALLILRLIGNEDSRKTLRVVLIALASVFSALILLFALILNILMAPFQYDGILGAFQEKYSYLVAEQEPFNDPLADAEIEAMVMAADTNDPIRQEILRTALSLVGRVPYFWGGKSAAGWNDKWNTLQVVTAPGVSSSGSLRPYGLDCSGFTDWVWRTAGLKSIGAGTHAQFWGSTSISEQELLPGDLVFKNTPNDEVINHVGIYYGQDDTGQKLYIHCSAGSGGVIINSYAGFKLWHRPNFREKEE